MIRGLYGEKANKRMKNDILKLSISKIRTHRIGFLLLLVQLDRYHADRAPASFMNAISRFRLTFFGYFNMHEDLSMIEEGDNGEERDDDRRDEETEEQKAYGRRLESIMKDPSNLNDCGVSTIIHLLYCSLIILTMIF